jgi:hypothetical protein
VPEIHVVRRLKIQKDVQIVVTGLFYSRVTDPYSFDNVPEPAF